MKALITRKVGMTSVIDDNDSATAVTLLSAEPCIVTQLKNSEVDGYTAVQLGFEKSEKNSKAVAGHLKKSKTQSKVLKEFRVGQLPDIQVGEAVNLDVFEVGDLVDVTSISKGKGFAGTIKRHNFHLGRKTHGGSSYRKPGSIGSMYPQRIFPGKKMAGRIGHSRTTIKRLKVALIDAELGVIGVVGAVPGPNKSIVTIREAK